MLLSCHSRRVGSGGLHRIWAIFKVSTLLLCSSSSLFGQGSLTPPGAPAPTMKTLAQVEPRIAITNSGPVTISRPGSYYLTTNISASFSTCINIVTNNVTIDLNGFSLLTSDPSPGSTGIYIINGLHDISVLNGHIVGGVTNNGGVYNGPGFFDGIYLNGGGRNIKVSQVSVSGCLYRGIIIGVGVTSTIEDCQVDTVGSYGLWATTIRNCMASGCGDTGIYGYEIVDCYCNNGSANPAISAITAQNCYAMNTNGDALFAQTALNCYAYCTGSGRGLYALNASNCKSYSAAYYGLVSSTSENCFSQSGGTSAAISTTTAQNCYAIANGSGTGLSASVVNNCYAYSASGTAISATIVTGSIGSASTLPGISCTIANSCVGYGTPGVSAVNRYNMP
jgi:hypothetical protein